MGQRQNRASATLALLGALVFTPRFLPALPCGPGLAQLCPSSALPPLTRDPSHLVVFGAGDVVMKFYSPAFRELLAEYGGSAHVSVTFVDNSRFSQGNPAMMAKRAQIVTEIEKWGGHVLDRNDPEQERQVRALQPDVVYIATPDQTHAAMAKESAALYPGARAIVLEKPVDRDLAAARSLASSDPALARRLLAVDHTLARLPEEPQTKRALIAPLGGGLKRFTFYFLEDGSGADPAREKTVARDGAIENAQRVRTLDQGMILDMMPHVLAVAGYFGSVESIQVDSVERMQYTGVDRDPAKRTEIKGETFAAIHFSFLGPDGNRVQATAYLGKGIRGVKALGPDYDHDVKVLDLIGKNGEHERLDLRSEGTGASTARIAAPDGHVEQTLALNPTPYLSFLRGSVTDHPAGTMPVERAVQILEAIEKMRGLGSQSSLTMPTYPGGMAAGPGREERPAPYLEDLLALLEHAR